MPLYAPAAAGFVPADSIISAEASASPPQTGNATLLFDDFLDIDLNSLSLPADIPSNLGLSITNGSDTVFEATEIGVWDVLVAVTPTSGNAGSIGLFGGNAISGVSGYLDQVELTGTNPATVYLHGTFVLNPGDQFTVDLTAGVGDQIVDYAMIQIVRVQ